MAIPQTHPREALQLTPAAPHDEPTLANLFDLYAREFSQFHPVEFNQDGSFTYPDLPNYWKDPDRYPFLIHIGAAIAGFALIRRDHALQTGKLVWDMAQFFVTPPFRRCGAGTAAAHQALTLFPGPWQVRVLGANHPALRFWLSAISMFTGQPALPVTLEVNGETWHVYRFDSPSSPNP